MSRALSSPSMPRERIGYATRKPFRQGRLHTWLGSAGEVHARPRTAIRGLQTFRRLHACPGCFRLERSPGGPCTHWKSAALSRRTWKTRQLAEDARPIPALWTGRPVIWAIVALQQRGRRILTEKIVGERLGRGLRAATNARNRRLYGESRLILMIVRTEPLPP